MTQSSLVKSNKPQLSASRGDIFHEFFYLQHVQSYHIANKGKFHLSHSKRMLYARFQTREHKFEPLLKKKKTIYSEKIKRKEKRNMHTWCIFTYVTTGNITGVSKPYPHMPASKLITHVDLPFQLRGLLDSTDIEWQPGENETEIWIVTCLKNDPLVENVKEAFTRGISYFFF